MDEIKTNNNFNSNNRNKIKDNKEKIFIVIIIILIIYIIFDKSLNRCLTLQEQITILKQENNKTYSEILKIKNILK